MYKRTCPKCGEVNYTASPRYALGCWNCGHIFRSSRSGDDSDPSSEREDKTKNSKLETRNSKLGNRDS